MKLSIVFGTIFISLFSCRENKEIYSIEMINVETLSPINIDFKTNYLDKIPGIKNSLGVDYQAYLYAEKIKNGNNTRFIYVVRDSYGIIHMLILDKNGSLISNTEIAGVNCATPKETESGAVEWCDERFSIFENDTIFKVINKDIYSEGFLESDPYVIDSTVTTFNISTKGVIKKVNEKTYHYNKTRVTND